MLPRTLAIGVDSTLPRLAVDGVIVALISVQVWLGWRYGLVRRAFVLLATFGATIAATYAGNAFGGLINAHDPDVNALCFIGVFVAISLVFETIGALASPHLRGLMVVMFDRCSGAAAGAVIGVLQAGVIALAVLSAGSAQARGTAVKPPPMWTTAEALRSATLGGAIVGLEPGVKAVLTPGLPANLETHLSGTVN
ncbi:MAG: CvpA family protein [Candidatus Dormibacteria bacterium]